MKHYIDIENLRDEEIDLGNGMFRPSNCGGFEVGDIIQISEKIDGGNSSLKYENGKLIAFSRKQELNFKNTLSGFWNFVQTLNPEEFADTPNYIFYGEWLLKNKITYNKDKTYQFYLYDIYDSETKQWQLQSVVKEQAEKHKFNYIHVLYEGEFISWDHVKTFLNSPAYGNKQEGCVIKNQSKLQYINSKLPAYLKIVNEDFKETMKEKIKQIDPEKEANKNKAQELMSSIVTENRVSKELLKMGDEGIIPKSITPKDMSLVAKLLPKRIWEDCIKEEQEICMAAGEYAGKICSSLTMQIARKIIIGE